MNNSSPPPVMTNVAVAEAVYLYGKAHTKVDIAIGEGCGSGRTDDVYVSVALTGMHLSGRKKKIGLVLAGFDPVAVDTLGSELLGHDPRWLTYLTLSNGLLGSMHDIEVLQA
ncbi:MAG: hypothetical protein JXM79_18760 [Sedimentisphaerales bacterium]|nr:hypothetical protein [Sedimentisphaerales bacterium]